MRRKEFSVAEVDAIESFLQSQNFGYLGTVGEDGWPHIKPLNFAYTQETIVLHGSKLGEKVTDLARDNRVTFTVARELSIIPSYFSDPKLACPATAYFQSITIYGHAVLVESLSEKATWLTAFMEKLQPEGGYAPIDSNDAEYAKNLAGVNVICIPAESITAKFKVGQNLHPTVFESITNQLFERKEPLDETTVEIMRRYCPHART